MPTRKTSYSSALFIWLLACMAPVSGQDYTDTQTTRTQIGDLPSTESKLTPTELGRAKYWDISESDWQRYKQLMQGIRGSISPANISPIEVLGIHARDDAERRRFAEIWARAMREDVGRILAFQQAYDAAGKRLFPNEQLIDPDRLPKATAQEDPFQPGDRALLFVEPDCPVCDRLVDKVLKYIDLLGGIDVYIANVPQGNDQVIRDWATGHGIDPQWVRNQRVTLNHEAGVLHGLTQGRGEIPTVLRRRGEEISVMKTAEL